MDLTTTLGAVGRVLVIDDEDGIRRALRRVLQDHDVTTASDGEEGLHVLRASRDPFDVILCDVGMPRMGGVAFARAVEQDFPAVFRRIVFMSGGWISPSDSRFLAGYEGVVVEKPFRIAGIRALVRDRIGLTRTPAHRGSPPSTVPMV